tara:strand:- start:654 stop:1238 length:585 start_codon:yes stop_codon:yes gene_type:complete
MTLNLKKFSYKYSFLKMDLEDTTTQAEKYIQEFNSFFGKYFVDQGQEVWINEETGEISTEDPLKVKKKKSKKQQPDKIKKLYRKLSTKTHPDKGGDVDDFNKVKEAYNDGNLMELLILAGRYDIKVDVTEEDETLLTKSCSNLEEQINGFKNSPAWNFYTGDKNKRYSILKMIEQQLGIEIPKEEYPDFLLEND